MRLIDRLYPIIILPLNFKRISMKCLMKNSIFNRESGYFYINIGEGQASDYDWILTFGTDRKVIFYVLGYGEDMHPEGNNCRFVHFLVGHF